MVKMYLHVVWSTKKRIPFLENCSSRNALWNFILHYGRSKGIYVDGVGGCVDHYLPPVLNGCDFISKTKKHIIKKIL